MLDKTKIYAGYTGTKRKFGQSPNKNFKKIKILFEDEISYYVESLTKKDSKNNNIRYSVKKHCFVLIDINSRNIPRVGYEYMHINGSGPYTVTVLANQHSNNPKYEFTVIYQGLNGKVWAKTLDNFMYKMIEI